MDAENQALAQSEEKELQPPAKRKRSHFKNRMHLWEFLLELLADDECRSLITWTNKERREFKILNTNEVARLWGLEYDRQNMTYDKLSRSLRTYYRDEIVTKVKGQMTTYKFDKLPYDYYPGVTRRRKNVARGMSNTPYPEHGMRYECVNPGQPTPCYSESGNYIFHNDPNWGATFWNNPQGQRSTGHSEFPVRSSFHPSSIFPAEASNLQVQANSSNIMNNLVPRAFSAFKMADTPFYPPSSFQVSFPQTATQVWFPDETRTARSAAVQRSADCWGTFASITPGSSRSSSPLHAVEQNGSRKVTPSVPTYAGTFVTPESSRPSSPLHATEQNGSRNLTPSSVPTYPGTYVTLKPSHYVMEQNGSRSVTPSSVAAYSPLPMHATNRVIWSNPIFPRVHTVPYQPMMYAVPVPYERPPVITSVVGNYQGHGNNN